jgi:hypothetical protein
MKTNSITLAIVAAIAVAALWLVVIPAEGQQTGPSDPSPAIPGGDPRAAAIAAAGAKIKEAVAVPTPRTVDGHPDISGFWANAMNFFGVGGPFNDGKAVTPEGKSVHPIAGAEEEEIAGDTASVAHRRADAAARPVYKPELVATANDNFTKASHIDPSFRCEPLGVPRLGAPSEIFEVGKAVALLYGNRNIYRVIPTDNRPHDADADSMPNGDAVGHWEGDTLIVDVTNLSEDTWLDGDGSFHDKNLHVIERFTRQGNTLGYEVIVEDPTLFEKPFSPRPQTLILGKPGEHAAEDYPCEELDQAHLTSNERH